MFILNALCCISEQPNQPLTPRSNIIKKAAVNPIYIESNISSSENSNTHHETNKENDFSTPTQKTLTFNKVIVCHDSFQSDECNPGSDPCSLEEQLSEKFVSPVQVEQNQKTRTTFNQTPTKHPSFYGWDLADTEVKQWSIKDVLKFLAKVGLRQYHSTFYENKIKGKDLVTLTQKQLREDLKMNDEDIRTISVYIQFLKEKSKRESKQKSLSRSFGGHRKSLSLYKYHCNTYSCRKILHMVKNPIMEEESEQESGQRCKRKENLTTKDVFSSTNLSQLLTN